MHRAEARGGAAGLGEDSTLEPTNPYSAAKAGAEMMARAYRTSYRLPVMIPKFTLLASRGQDLPIHGDGARPLPAAPPRKAAHSAPSPILCLDARLLLDARPGPAHPRQRRAPLQPPPPAHPTLVRLLGSEYGHCARRTTACKGEGAAEPQPCRALAILTAAPHPG